MRLRANSKRDLLRKQIIELACQRYKEDDIAVMVGCSPKTVYNVLRNDINDSAKNEMANIAQNQIAKEWKLSVAFKINCIRYLVKLRDSTRSDYIKIQCVNLANTINDQLKESVGDAPIILDNILRVQCYQQQEEYQEHQKLDYDLRQQQIEQERLKEELGSK